MIWRGRSRDCVGRRGVRSRKKLGVVNLNGVDYRISGMVELLQLHQQSFSSLDACMLSGWLAIGGPPPPRA